MNNQRYAQQQNFSRYNSHPEMNARHPGNSGNITPQPQNPVNQSSIDNSSRTANTSEASNSNEYFSLRSHSTKSAICVYPSETKKKWSTINIEGAVRNNPNNNADRTYRWDNKITIQVTQTELPDIISVFLGFKTNCDFSNHGDTNKRYIIENQGKNFVCKIYEKDKPSIVCPIQPPEAFMIGTLAISQYTSNFKGVTTDTVLTSLRMMNKNRREAG